MNYDLRRYQAWLIVFSSFTIYAYIVSTIGPMIPKIFSDFPTKYELQGFIISLYSLMGFAAIFGGHIYDRFGPRTNSLALMLLGIGMIILLTSSNIVFIGISLIILGLGAAVIEAASSAISVDIYQERRGMSLNLLHFAWNVGSTIGPPTAVTIVIYSNSWRNVYITPLIIVSLLSVLSYKFFADNKPIINAKSKIFINIRKTLQVTIVAMFIVSLERAIGLWLPTLLSVIGIETITMGLTMGLYWALMGVGRIFWSIFTDRLGYGRTILLTVVIATLILSIAAVSSSIEIKLFFWPLTGFFLAPIYPNIIAWITKNQLASSGYASGLTFTMGSVGSLFITNVIGLSMSLWGIESIQFIYPVLSLLASLYTLCIYLKHK
ncbi:MAG: MFS transporter [Nitrososphaerota archaeon]